MIQLRTKSGTIDLPPNETVTVEESSPFIDKEFRRGLFSLPFSIFGTRNNLQILGNYSLEENNNNFSIPCDLISDDVFICSGFIYLNSIIRDNSTGLVTYRVTFSNEIGLFAKKIENLKIKDCYKYQENIAASTAGCIIGTSVNSSMLPTTTHVNNSYLSPNPEYNFPFLMFKLESEDSTTRSEYKFANKNEVFNFNVSPGFNNDLVLRHSLIVTGPPGIDFYAFPYRNSQVDDPFYLGTEYATMGSYIVPCFYYHKVLKACFEKVGYTAEFNFRSIAIKSFFEKIQFVNNYNILKPIFKNTVISNTNVDTEIWEDATEINSDNHLPDLLVKDLINDFMMKFGTYPKIDGNKITFEIIDLDNKTEQLNAIHPQIEFLLSKSTDITFSYKYPNESNVQNSPDYAFSVSEDGKEEKIYNNLPPVNQGNFFVYDIDRMYHGTRAVMGTIPGPYSYLGFEIYSRNGYFESDVSHPAGNKIESTAGGTTDSWYENQYQFDCPLGLFIANYFQKTWVDGLGQTQIYKTLTAHKLDEATGLSLDWTNGGGTGLVDQNYATAGALFKTGRKTKIKAMHNYVQLLSFDWNTKKYAMGQQFSATKRKFKLPLSRNPYVEYELYQL